MIARDALEPRPPRISLLFAAVAASVLWLGCSQNQDAFKKQLDRLRVDIVQLRAENLTLQDRVAELEDRDQTDGPAKPPKTGVVDRPRLAVVRLTPEAEQAPVIAPPGDSDSQVAASEEEPPLDLKLDGEASSSKTYRYHRPRRPNTRSAPKR